MFNASKNYSDTNGNRTVIGGELAIIGDGKITLNGKKIDLTSLIAPDPPTTASVDQITQTGARLTFE